MKYIFFLLQKGVETENETFLKKPQKQSHPFFLETKKINQGEEGVLSLLAVCCVGGVVAVLFSLACVCLCTRTCRVGAALAAPCICFVSQEGCRRRTEEFLVRSLTLPFASAPSRLVPFRSSDPVVRIPNALIVGSRRVERRSVVVLFFLVLCSSLLRCCFLDCPLHSFLTPPHPTPPRHATSFIAQKILRCLLSQTANSTCRTRADTT